MMFDIPLRQDKRHILHVDADAFFASVEQILNPSLKGKAILVGDANSNKGIVAACSYEAKALGIKTAMPMYLAKRKCPQAIIVPSHSHAYRDFSRKMYEIFIKYTPHTEMASIDEGYLDITGFDKAYKKPPEEIARSLLMDIYNTLGLSVSCGLATNKTVAKVASSLNKPHKLTVIPFGKECGFLANLGLRAMPGVGPSTFSLLDTFGFKTIGDFAAIEVKEVVEKLGVSGIPLWKRCRGFDNSKVISACCLPKSVSKEKTFYAPDVDMKKCIKTLKHLSSQVFETLRSHGMKAKTVFIRIRYKNNAQGKAYFEDFGFQNKLGFYGSADSELYPILKDLFFKNIDKERPIRLVGVGVSNLVENYNLNLFIDSKRKDELFGVIDGVRKLYGSESLKYGE